MIDTERRGLMRKLGSGLVVRNVAKLAHNPRLRQAVARKLRSNWSPEQIAGWLKRAYPADEFDRVSHETILSQLICSSPRRA